MKDIKSQNIHFHFEFDRLLAIFVLSAIDLIRIARSGIDKSIKFLAVVYWYCADYKLLFRRVRERIDIEGNCFVRKTFPYPDFHLHSIVDERPHRPTGADSLWGWVRWDFIAMWNFLANWILSFMLLDTAVQTRRGTSQHYKSLD